eukprot:3925745-Rhodomonas_salina.7
MQRAYAVLTQGRVRGYEGTGTEIGHDIIELRVLKSSIMLSRATMTSGPRCTLRVRRATGKWRYSPLLSATSLRACYAMSAADLPRTAYARATPRLVLMSRVCCYQEYLIGMRADPNSKDRYYTSGTDAGYAATRWGGTPLQDAVHGGHVTIASLLRYGIGLRAGYALSGARAAYGATNHRRYAVLTSRMVLPVVGAVRAKKGRLPSKTGTEQVRAPIRLRACYAMPGTDVAYGATAIRLRFRYAVPGTDVAYGAARYARRQGKVMSGSMLPIGLRVVYATFLRICYAIGLCFRCAMPGTDGAYATTRQLRLLHECGVRTDVGDYDDR